MAGIPFEIVEEAFDFVSFGDWGDNQAVLCRETGEVFYHSDSPALDLDEQLPEDAEENPAYVFIPHKQDLDLGRRVAVDFAASHLEDPHVVGRIFNGPGAYGRWKVLLEERGLLPAWFDFELAESRAALRRWCAEEGIELEPQPVG